MTEKPLISARNLSVGFKVGAGFFNKSILKAVDDVTLDIARGSFFGLVGESGSGKTTLGRAFLKAVATHDRARHHRRTAGGDGSDQQS